MSPPVLYVVPERSAAGRPRPNSLFGASIVMLWAKLAQRRFPLMDASSVTVSPMSASSRLSSVSDWRRTAASGQIAPNLAVPVA